MSVMEYYPQERRHPTARSASVASSNSQVENDLSDYQDSASDLSMDSRSIYVLSGPPPAPPAGSHLSACTALSGELRSMPLHTDKSVNGGGYATPGASNTDVIGSMHDWECVRSMQRLSASTDPNDSECGTAEEWVHTSRDPATRTRDDGSEPESWALGIDEDAGMHWHAAHQWDLIPEYFTPGVPIPKDTLRTHGRPLDSRRTPRPEQLRRSARSETVHPIPHHRIRFPLLPILVSLLSIDDETLQLVEHSPAHSELFPSPVYSFGDRTNDPQDQEIHGIHVLLEPSNQCGALRKGLAIACDESVLSFNPFNLSASRFIGLLDMAKGFWERGRKPFAKYPDE